jgi:hypothetical protein
MTDAPTLFSSAQCFVCFGELSIGEALELGLLQRINAMAADPQTLISEGHCFVCYGANTFELLKLALLARISKAHNAANDVTPQGLLAQGQCLECYGMVSIPKLMELVLLNQIAT